MLSRPFSRTSFCLVVLALLAVSMSCGGGGRRAPATPRDVPVAGVPPTGDAVQALYESGRYRELVGSASAEATSAEAIWYVAQSHLRLGQPEEARRQFERLPSVGAGPSWRVVSDLALAILNDDRETLGRARAAADQFPGDPFVQFELGLALIRQNDFAGAAQAFDRCTEANPRFAYAYYNSGLAYDRLNRADLMTNRLEMFQRLAPAAPERAEVDTILRAVRGR